MLELSAPHEEAEVLMASAKDCYLPARKVWERYGVTAMSLHRWLRDKEMDFPQPTYLGRLRYWRLSSLEAWERQQARRKAA
jgi:predicted DNA-binding transcriptional regulator AlpA